MKTYPLIITTLFFIFCNSQLNGQKRFDSLHVEKILTTLPKQVNQVYFNDSVIKAIEAVDRKYREIVDTLYGFESFRHTIIETILIETEYSSPINPLSFGDKIKTSSIIFDYAELNAKLNSIAKSLNNQEKGKLYDYIKTNYQWFSPIGKKLKAQPVRIRYVKFPNNKSAQVGIDIYGAHFLWTIDRTNNWDVVKVEQLWVY